MVTANPRNTLSQLVVWDKYASFLPEVSRRENWDEIVMRLEDMYLEKFPQLKNEIREVCNSIRRKEILPSMRSMQFGGQPIFTHPSRYYNCSFHHMKKHAETFAEVMYNLLSGSGVGYSVQKHHVDQYPVVKGANKKFTRRYRIHDQIEGWADAVLVEVKSQFEGTAEIRFDPSDIRGPDTLIKSSGRKAPGPEKLMFILGKIREIFEGARGRKLKPIEVHDICCWIAWCVVAGGVRRSAMISLFSLDDEEMMNCKAGAWWETNPQRGRANNSAVLLRGAVTEQQFRELMKQVEVNRTGEPGLFWTNDLELGCNPCAIASAPIIKRIGNESQLTTLGDIKVGDEIWSKEGWTKVVNKWSNGVKKVYKFNTTRAVFYGTVNHPVVSDQELVEVSSGEKIDTVVGPDPCLNSVKHDPDWVMTGLLLGDGTYDKNWKEMRLCVGANDLCYMDSEISHLIKYPRKEADQYSVHLPECYDRADFGVKTFDRNLSSYKYTATKEQLCSLLRGLYSANGSIVGKSSRITLKAASFQMIEDVQIVLNYLGINSYYTTNKPSTIEWKNGTYTSKQSYDLNISTDKAKFMELIGFIHPDKNERVKIGNTNPKPTSSQVVFQTDLGYQEVWDITVDNESHTYWCGGMDVHNCGEISLKDQQFCNLTSINFATVKDEKDFLNRVRLATFLGTLQASFTDFLYLRDGWVKNCQQEALLGVSITGMCENLPLFYSINFDKATRLAKRVNTKVAKQIGIRPSARLLTIKPEGTGTLAVEAVTAGVHYGPAKHWIKHFTLDKNTDLYKFLLDRMPSYVIDSPYVAHEAYFAIPLALPDHVNETEENTTALDTLDRIRFVYENWVVKGHRRGKNTHNVSCTVRVRDEEWEGVTDWMWDNRDRYAAISFLHMSDTSAWTILPQQSISEDQYQAMLNGGEFNGHLYDGWKDIDFNELTEIANNVDLNNELACAGGACLI